VREWAKSALWIIPSIALGIVLYWRDRIGDVWLLPVSLAVGIVVTTLYELWNRPGEFVRDVR